MLVERGNILLDTYKHHLPKHHLLCIFRLLQYNKIILSIHSTLLDVVGVVQSCGVGIIFNCIEITTSYIGAVKLNIIILATSRLTTFLLREILLWHPLR